MTEEKIREVVYETTNEVIRSYVVKFGYGTFYIEETYKFKYNDGVFNVSKRCFSIHGEDNFLALVDAVLGIFRPTLTTEENKLALKLQELLKKHLKKNE